MSLGYALFYHRGSGTCSTCPTSMLCEEMAESCLMRRTLVLKRLAMRYRVSPFTTMYSQVVWAAVCFAML